MNRQHEQRNLNIARADNICKVQRQADPDGSSKPRLIPYDLYDEVSLARTVIKIQVDNLLPRAQCQLPIHEGDRE